MTPLTQIVKEELSVLISPGDIVIDATAGNGHDTAFLAASVGNQGQVFAFDIQQQAIDNTRARLSGKQLDKQVTLFHASHDCMLDLIPKELQKKISVIMFNLGYLPGADKSMITQTTSTLSALQQSLLLLKENGVLSIMLYPGHAGGEEETLAIFDWSKTLDDRYVQKHLETAGPHWLLISGAR